MHSQISYALRALRLLAILEHAPKYGRQLARIAPDLFFSDPHVLVGEKPDRVRSQHIYMTLSRLMKAGLIQRRENYTPPATVEIPSRFRRGIVWYELSPNGRKTLRESRTALKVYIGEPHA